MALSILVNFTYVETCPYDNLVSVGAQVRKSEAVFVDDTELN